MIRKLLLLSLTAVAAAVATWDQSCPDPQPDGLCVAPTYQPALASVSWVQSQFVPCYHRDTLPSQVQRVLRWPTRQMAPLIAKGGVAFLLAYSALHKAAPSSPKPPLRDLATPDVDFMTVVSDTALQLRRPLPSQAATRLAMDALKHAAMHWTDGMTEYAAVGQVAAAIHSLAQNSKSPPSVLSLAHLVLQLHAAAPRVLIPEHASGALQRKGTCAKALRAAAIAAGVLLAPHVPRNTASSSDDLQAQLLSISSEPISAFDALCFVGDLTHTAQDIIAARPEWFEVPSYPGGYMDDIHWTTAEELRHIAWNASERYGMQALPGVPMSVSQAEAALTLNVPGAGLVHTPAALVGSALDGLSSNRLNFIKMRQHPADDARSKLHRRLARVRHAVAVHTWLQLATDEQLAQVPAEWQTKFLLSPVLLDSAAELESVLRDTPVHGSTCYAVYLHEDDTNMEFPWHSDEPEECHHPAAYVNVQHLPKGKSGRPCPRLVGVCGSSMV